MSPIPESIESDVTNINVMRIMIKAQEVWLKKTATTTTTTQEQQPFFRAMLQMLTLKYTLMLLSVEQLGNRQQNIRFILYIRVN